MLVAGPGDAASVSPHVLLVWGSKCMSDAKWQVPRDAERPFRVPHLHANIEQAFATATFEKALPTQWRVRIRHPSNCCSKRRKLTFVDKPFADALAQAPRQNT